MNNSAVSGRNALLALLVLSGTIRLAALMVWGPLYQGDSASFIAVAEIMSRDFSWLSESGHNEVLRPPTTFRALGYSGLIAFAVLLFGDSFDIAIVCFQSAITLVVTGLIFSFATRLGLSLAVSFFAGLAYSVSLILLFDLNILVDSLFANGLVASAVLLATGALRGTPPSNLALLLIGLILAATMLLRETTMYFAPFIALGAVIWGWQPDGRKSRAAACFALVLLPIFLLTVGYREWNRQRSGGETFITTGAQMSMWFGPLEVAAVLGPEVFSYDPRVQAAIQAAANADAPMSGAKMVNRYLFDTEGIRANEIGRLAFQAYLHAAQVAPLTLLKSRLARLKPRTAFLSFNPSHAMRIIIEMGEKRRIPGFSEQVRRVRRGEAGVGVVLLLTIDVLQRVISAILLLAFVFGVPALIVSRLWRNQTIEKPLLVLVTFWLTHWALYGAYTLVSFEERYVIAASQFACIGGLWVLSRRVYFLRAVRKEYS